ncbi:hypothetical protein [Parabacteroides sp. FAFU027]|uniref:hypothetical protein n=1 Tax=Parabacteroides sp. FAFU027 TaxID=2922715 RepID=UPI001FAF6EF0|nr:hypothetical protein [Parabacteroides sp. FAFU027]
MMTRRELNQYNMQQKLAAFLNRNLDKIKDNPSIIAGLHKLSVYNFDIYALENTHAGNESAWEKALKIKRMIKDCRILLSECMDMLMLPFQITHPDFYKEYVNNRVVAHQTHHIHSMQTVAV